MIKGILFDWHGVLVENDNCDEDRRKELYSKLLQNIATESEIIEAVKSFKKYEKLWSILPTLKKNFKMCVVNNGPKATYEYWDKYYNYSPFMDFINSDMVGVKKPNAEIYLIACEKLGVKPNEVIYMDDNYGFPEETEKLGMKFIHWNTLDDGFEAFKQYLNEHTDIKI